jgi:hypothetical protein
MLLLWIVTGHCISKIGRLSMINLPNKMVNHQISNSQENHNSLNPATTLDDFMKIRELVVKILLI